MTELDFLIDRIMNCLTPEELFGGTTEQEAKINYLYLQKHIHPDHNPGNEEKVHEASAKLNVRWEEAKKRFAAGLWLTDEPLKTAEPITFSTKKYNYTMTPMKKGAMCGIFSAVITDRRGIVVHGLVKVPHTKKDNDLIDREVVSLTKIKKYLAQLSKPEYENALLLVPQIHEIFRQRDGSKCIVFSRPTGYETGWYTLEDIAKAYPNGVTSRQLAFIGNRLFESLSFAHLQNIPHNAINPNHVIIHAEKHLGQVIDYTCSGRPLPYYVDRSFLAPEAKIMKSCNMSADVYAAAKCLLYITQYEDDVINLEEPFVKFFNLCIQPHRHNRPKNAYSAWLGFQEIQRKVFGERKFVELEMPLC